MLQALALRRGVDRVVGELTVGVTGACVLVLFSSSGLESPLDQSSDIVLAKEKENKYYSTRIRYFAIAILLKRIAPVYVMLLNPDHPPWVESRCYYCINSSEANFNQ